MYFSSYELGRRFFAVRYILDIKRIWVINLIKSSYHFTKFTCQDPSRYVILIIPKGLVSDALNIPLEYSKI